MASLNKVMLIGHLGRDPDIRRLHNGDQVASLRLATSETWRDKQTGERTEWHQVVIFNEALVRVVEQYLKKGSKIFVEGQLQTRKWTDQAGVEKYTTEIVLSRFRGELQLLDGRPRDDAGSAERQDSSGSGFGQGAGTGRRIDDD